MADETTTTIGSLADLENTAKQASEQFNKASSDNAIWDKAFKSLGGGLANLDKATADAKAAAEDAANWSNAVGENYKNDLSQRVRDLRKQEDTKIDGLKQAVADKETGLNAAKAALADATAARTTSQAAFDAAQKELLNLPKAIGDKQKQVATLRTEAKDAHSKHLLVDTVVKLEDLNQAIQELQAMLADQSKAQLWAKLNDAGKDVIAKSDALPAAQQGVPDADTALAAAKKARDDAQTGRLENIKADLAQPAPQATQPAAQATQPAAQATQPAAQATQPAAQAAQVAPYSAPQATQAPQRESASYDDTKQE